MSEYVFMLLQPVKLSYGLCQHSWCLMHYHPTSVLSSLFKAHNDCQQSHCRFQSMGRVYEVCIHCLSLIFTPANAVCLKGTSSCHLWSVYFSVFNSTVQPLRQDCSSHSFVKSGGPTRAKSVILGLKTFSCRLKRYAIDTIPHDQLHKEIKLWANGKEARNTWKRWRPYLYGQSTACTSAGESLCLKQWTLETTGGHLCAGMNMCYRQ